ncbi:MAG: tetratricopeptide repeat protein [Niastella sp.]|nr:tetratricopeptide repeat protein [Niastella sp.]
MTAKPFFLWLLLFAGPALYAQPDIPSSLSQDEQVERLYKWYKLTVLTLQDSTHAINTLQAAETKYQDDAFLAQQSWLLHRIYVATVLRGGQRSVDEMLQTEKEAKDRGWLIIQAECWFHIGNLYFLLNKFGPAFEYMQRGRYFLEEKGMGNLPYLKRYAGGLAECYFRFGEYDQAIKYYKETRDLPDYWNGVIYFASLENSIALCYQQTKQYDSAIYFFKQSHTSAAAANDSFYMTLAYGNMGYTYHLMGQDSLALPLLQQDYAGSLKAREWGSAANAAMILISIYISQRNTTMAEQYLTLARSHVYALNGVGLYRSWYDNLYKYYLLKGNHALALQYADSLLFYKDSLAAIRSIRTLNQAKLKVETERYMNTVHELEAQRRQQVFIRNGILVAVLLAGIIGLLWVNRQRLKRNKELQLAALAREKAQQELLFARQELIGYTDKLKEKNDLIEQFRQELEQLQQNDVQENRERTENINRLLNATILTEDDWRTFRDLFEKVYPGFFVRLRDKMPDLSAADTRLIALTKLQLPPKDMAAMLGVSYDAIKKARQRLRKKINLPEEGSLDELAEMI